MDRGRDDGALDGVRLTPGIDRALDAVQPSYLVVDGFRLPLGFPADGFLSGREYQAQRGDIFVSSYPKCGTTWVQHIVYLLLNRGRPLTAEQSLTDVFPHLEEVGRAAVEALPKPRLIKTHLPLAMTPFSSAAKYVYVVRNPFDCAVSFFHHTRGFEKHYRFSGGTFDEFFECFIRGEVDFGGYFDNVVPWYELRDEPNVCCVSYEALKADATAGIERIGEFLGGEAAAVSSDLGFLRDVVEHSSFERMKRDQQRWSSRRPAEMPPFVRKGVVGDWRSHFSPAQAARLLRLAERRAAGTPLLALWPDIVDDVRRQSI